VVYLREEVRDFYFDVFARLDVLGDAAVLGREFVQKRRVHVVADAEGEQPHAGDARPSRVLDYALRVRLADGRKPVRHEDEHARAIRLLEHSHRGQQRAVYVRAPYGPERRDEPLAERLAGRVRAHEARGHKALLAREVYDVEAVFRAQRAHAEQKRRARLLHLARLGHRA
jgi:hypothetical protein